MRTLIIPDVHEQIEKLEAIEKELVPLADRVVMLGDFFDSFGPRHSARIATWLRNHLDEYDICWGNHDISYAFGGNFRCSGYDWHTQDAANRLHKSDWWKLKVFTRVGKFLVSHAGFHPKTISMATDEAVARAIDHGFKGIQDPMWGAGASRGGRNLRGGPVWLDWNEEFEAFDTPQIVGHTFSTEHKVRHKVYNPDKILGPEPPTSYCLDTGLNHVMWVDEETNHVEIVELDWLKKEQDAKKP